MQLRAYFDGACAPRNPGGVCAYGALILEDGLPIVEISEIVQMPEGDEGKTSNNVAEYCGLLAVLAWLKTNGRNNEAIEIRGDSMLVVNQMKGLWAINEGFYRARALECQEAMKAFPNAELSWIPREKNRDADALSKMRLVEKGIMKP